MLKSTEIMISVAHQIDWGLKLKINYLSVYIIIIISLKYLEIFATDYMIIINE